MLNISRWSSEKGSSYSSVRRFYESSIDWMAISLELFKHYYHCSERVYLLCGDETVEGKAGKKTPGKGWFYNSIYGVPIPGVCFFNLSVLDVSRGTSWVVGHEQLEKDPKGHKKKSKKKKKSASAKNTEQEQQPSVPKKRGRKKGSKNKPYQVGYLFTVLSALLGRFKTHLASVGCTMPICYFVGDGHYGNRSGCKVCLDNDLNLISTLRYNAALYYNYTGPQKRFGRRRKHGKRVDFTKLRKDDLVYKDSTEEFDTFIYQIQAWNKRIPYCLLNVVILVVYDKEKQEWARQLYFSTDLNLSYSTLMDYYHLRAQIELNFRDAKQYFGLSDFKNIKPEGVKNAVGLSFFMTNLSKVLVEQYQQLTGEQDLSIQDLKAYFRGIKYVEEVIKNFQNGEEIIFKDEDYLEIAKVGAINR